MQESVLVDWYLILVAARASEELEFCAWVIGGIEFVQESVTMLALCCLRYKFVPDEELELVFRCLHLTQQAPQGYLLTRWHFAE